MSNVLIIVNRNNIDRNGLFDIAAAVQDAGARVVDINEDRFAIEAAVALNTLPTISAMEGVSYVRNVFSYFCAPEAVEEMQAA